MLGASWTLARPIQARASSIKLLGYWAMRLWSYQVCFSRCRAIFIACRRRRFQVLFFLPLRCYRQMVMLSRRSVCFSIDDCQSPMSNRRCSIVHISPVYDLRRFSDNYFSKKELWGDPGQNKELCESAVVSRDFESFPIVRWLLAAWLVVRLWQVMAILC